MDESLDKGASKQPYTRKAADKIFAGAEQPLFKQAAELRSQQTHAEEVLWSYLRTKLQGFKFRRQHPCLVYILAFYCHAFHLVIEVDGSVHYQEDVKAADEIRQRNLEEHSLTIILFTNDEIEHKPEDVITRLEHYLFSNARPNSEKQYRPKSPL
jgi:very-short-patch-repair endonuclease